MSALYNAKGAPIPIGGSSKLPSLKIGILGDSVTEGTGASTPSKSYAKLLEADFREVKNYGIGGTCISQTWSKPMVGRYNAMDADLDVVVLFGGINDFYANVAIDTFKAAVDTILTGWQNKYFGKEIICITPYQVDNGSKGSYDTNTQGKTMADYVDALKDRCAYHAVPLLNLFETSGIAADVVGSQNTHWLADGIHPNDEGHQRLHDRIVHFCNALFG